MTPPPETLSLVGMAGVALFCAVKLLRARRAGELRRPAAASGQ